MNYGIIIRSIIPPNEINNGTVSIESIAKGINILEIFYWVLFFVVLLILFHYLVRCSGRKNVAYNILTIVAILGCFCGLYSINVEQNNLKEKIQIQMNIENKKRINSPEGQDEIAHKLSLNGDIVLSKTGKHYYRGMLCSKDCSGHKAGYEWAWNLGITSEDACYNKSESFQEGCLKAIKEIMQELREYFKEEYPEDYCDNDDYYDYESSRHWYD